MKQDYLWDKTGEDPEIKELENALAVFRYVAAEPPALPAKIVPFERKTSREFFRLAFAFTAFAAFVIVSLGVWFQFSVGKKQVAENLTETFAPPVAEKISDETPIKKTDILIGKKIETPKQSVERKSIKIKKIVPLTARRNQTIVQTIAFKKPPVKLSKEETYAYNQLMLALSITSSKLKIVEDKIYGAEEPKSVLENER